MDYLIYESRRSPKSARRFSHNVFRSAKRLALDAELRQSYAECKGLVIYGLGGSDRWSMSKEHKRKGGNVFSFDIGYWERNRNRRKYRFSINGLHPTPEMIMATEPNPDRFGLSGLNVIRTPRQNRTNTIMLVGNAPKSIAVGARNWSVEMSRQLRKAFPEKTILYRPKPRRPSEKNVVFDVQSTEPIESALNRVDLVVTRHSNVAIDAGLRGIPVVSTHGAAATIYPNRLEDWQDQPSYQDRLEFFYRLAYWQWRSNELTHFWNWFLRTFPAYDYR